MAKPFTRQLKSLLPRIFDPKLKGNLHGYILQASLAAGALAVILVVQDVASGGAISRGILVAALGSTAFILFMTPHTDRARPRRVIGGHLIALATGATLGALAGSAGGELHLGIEAALAVGLSMFFMAATDTEHPPAAGTAMAVSASSFTWMLPLMFISSVLLLVAAHHLLRRRLRNLD